MLTPTQTKKSTRDFILLIEAPRVHLPLDVARRMKTKTQPTRGKKKAARVNQKKEW